MKTEKTAKALHSMSAGWRTSLPRRMPHIAALFLVLLFGHSNGRADSWDVTESLPLGASTFAGQAIGGYADVDGDGTQETFVVFCTVEGSASVLPTSGPSTGSQDYSFTGRSWIRFVNAQAPGFRPDDPATWIYRSVDGVRLVSRTYGHGSFEIYAYSEINTGGSLVASCTSSNATGSYSPPLTLEFNRPGAIKEIALSSSGSANGFCDLLSLVIRSIGVDAGLRAYDGTGTVKFACEAPGQEFSPLRIDKNGASCGTLLTSTNSPDASKFRIQTASGVKALKKLP